jgi:hypothetical protein
MGLAMRRLKNFLPIVLIALAVQIFAPIGACWAASIAASDPLGGAVICHGNAAGAAPSDQTGPHRAHDGCCSVCSVLHTGAPVETPQTALIFTFDREPERVVWHKFPNDLADAGAGSPPQARAPPQLT